MNSKFSLIVLPLVASTTLFGCSNILEKSQKSSSPETITNSNIKTSKTAENNLENNKTQDILDTQLSNSNSRKATLVSNQVTQSWKTFQGENMELKLPNSFEGGSKRDLDTVINKLKSFGPQYQTLAQTVERNRSAIQIFAFDSEIGSSGLATNVNVISQKIPSNISLERYLKATQSQLPSDFQVIDTKITSVNGYQTGRLITNFNRPGIKGKQALYAIKNNNQIWAIAYTTGANEFEERLPVFEQSISTFQVK